MGIIGFIIGIYQLYGIIYDYIFKWYVFTYILR